jgi:GTP-binding protein
MVVANTCSKSEGTPQMLIYFIFSFTGRIAIGRLERGILKEGMPISLVKEMVLYLNLSIKELIL